VGLDSGLAIALDEGIYTHGGREMLANYAGVENGHAGR